MPQKARVLMWYFFAVSSLLAGIICGFLGIFVYGKHREHEHNRTFAVVSILIGIWSLFPFVTAIAPDPASALRNGRIVYLAALFAPAAFFHFVFTILGVFKRKIIRRAIYAFYAVSLLFLPFLFSPHLIRGVIARSPGSSVVPGPLYPFYIAFFIALCPYAIYQMYVIYRSSSGYRKEQLKFLSLGFFVAMVAGGMHLFSAYAPIEVIPHDLLLIAWACIIAYAIVRHKFLDIRTVLTNAGIFLLLYTLVLGIPFWLGFGQGRWKLSTFLMAVLASGGPFIYLGLKKKAENILLAEQKRYQRVLLQASEGMVRQHSLDKLLKLIVHIIKRAVQLDYAAAYIDDREEKVFRLHNARTSGGQLPVVTFTYDHPFVRYIGKERAPFTFEEIPPSIKTMLPEDLNPQLIIPSFTQDRLLGFLLLGEKKNKTLFSQDDFSVFKTLSNQAALALENCLFMREFKQTQERLFNAEKLASVGGMADGLAHQIKNRLNQFSLAGGEMVLEIDEMKQKESEVLAANPRIGKNLDYLRTCATSITDNVKKTLSIVQGILNFARTEKKDSYFGEFSLREIIGHCVELLKVKHQIASFPLTVEIPENDTLYGVKAQIMDSLYNLMDNGYEAIREKIEYRLSAEERDHFSPEIRLSLEVKEKAFLIAIRDNGVGIKEENKAKIFSPFFTTKPSSKSGSGIGAYVVRRMIEENHQGRIRFESEYGQGTTFYIELPKKKSLPAPATDRPSLT